MPPNLEYLPAPAIGYLTKSQLADWLGIDEDELTRQIEAGRVPRGTVRPGKKRPTWTSLEAAVSKWTLDHLDRFESKGE